MPIIRVPLEGVTNREAARDTPGHVPVQRARGAPAGPGGNQPPGKEQQVKVAHQQHGKAGALTPADLVMVILVREKPGDHSPMPALGIRDLGRTARALARGGVGAAKVFASGDQRDRAGSGGKAGGSLMSRAIGEVKAAAPPMVVMTETCLCSYTDTGECHITAQSGKPDIAGTIEAIAEQAVAQAAAGADIVGPAAMIDGSVSIIRQALDSAGHPRVQIMPHLIFELDPAQPAAAITTALGMVAEGADMLLLEPALFCADLLIELKQACPAPLAPFSVSGEYLRLRRGEDLRLLVELFTMLKRAGADQIITYAAADLAPSLG
jgi:porphobilinogen synthase